MCSPPPPFFDNFFDSPCVRFLLEGQCIASCPVLPPAQHEAGIVPGFYPYHSVGAGATGRRCDADPTNACGIANCSQCLLSGDDGYASAATASIRAGSSPVCTACRAGTHLLNGRCVPTCPSSYTTSGAVCVSGCATGCAAPTPTCGTSDVNAITALSQFGVPLPFQLDVCIA